MESREGRALLDCKFRDARKIAIRADLVPKRVLHYRVLESALFAPAPHTVKCLLVFMFSVLLVPGDCDIDASGGSFWVGHDPVVDAKYDLFCGSRAVITIVAWGKEKERCSLLARTFPSCNIERSLEFSSHRVDIAGTNAFDVDLDAPVEFLGG